MDRIPIDEMMARVQEHWRPKVIAELNGQEIKIVKIKGEFPWHCHADADEMFMGWKGSFRLEFRDRVVHCGPGDIIVIPSGVEHRPVATEEAEILIFEPTGVRNTGNLIDERFTAPMGTKA